MVRSNAGEVIMCEIANVLRWQLYQASLHYRPLNGAGVPDAEALAAIHADQASDGHQGALQRLQAHLAEHGCCHEISNEWMEES